MLGEGFEGVLCKRMDEFSIFSHFWVNPAVFDDVSRPETMEACATKSETVFDDKFLMFSPNPSLISNLVVAESGDMS